EPVPLAARAAVVVDDGVVTGLTLAAACRWARSLEVARLVAATPVAHVAGLARVREEAYDVVCPSPLEEIAVVGQAYDSFEPLDEWYVAGPPRRMTLVIIDAENVRRSPWPNLSGEAGGTGGRRRSARFKSRGSSWTVSRTST